MSGNFNLRRWYCLALVLELSDIDAAASQLRLFLRANVTSRIMRLSKTYISAWDDQKTNVVVLDITRIDTILPSAFRLAA